MLDRDTTYSSCAKCVLSIWLLCMACSSGQAPAVETTEPVPSPPVAATPAARASSDDFAVQAGREGALEARNATQHYALQLDAQGAVFSASAGDWQATLATTAIQCGSRR